MNVELGLFQLENLFQNPNRFSFFDLRRERKPSTPQIEKLLKQAIEASAHDLVERLTAEKVAKEHPIVLVCETGATSAQLARELESAGFEQIYIVAGGVEGLLSET